MTIYIQGNAGKVRTISKVTLSCGHLHMGTIMWADKQKFSISGQTPDVIERTYQLQWPIGTDGERNLCRQ